MPSTAPRQVVPLYGTVMESVPRVAVPVSLIAQEVSPGAVAFPSAVQAIAAAEVKEPCAVPVNLKSPGQLALNEPFADVPVCSVTFHLKSVQVPGVGTSEDEVQLPMRALFPPADGEVSELPRSTLVQAAAATAVAEKTISRSRFFILCIQDGYRAHGRPGIVAGSEKYTIADSSNCPQI